MYIVSMHGNPEAIDATQKALEDLADQVEAGEVEPFQVIVADPPWRYPRKQLYKNYIPYETMATDDICAMPVQRIGAKSSVLYLWCVSGLLADALRVMEAWGYTHKTYIYWRKVYPSGKLAHGLGQWVRASSELCLVGVRGKGVLGHRLHKSFPQELSAPNEGHSVKPPLFYARVAEYWDYDRRLELFATRTREGWTSWGLGLNGLH